MILHSTARRLLAGFALLAAPFAADPALGQVDHPTGPIEEVTSFERGDLGPMLVEANALIRAPQARSTYNVDGSGLVVAVFDTGINTSHNDFAGRIVGGRNYSTADGGNVNIFEDRHAHGSNVAGIVMAKGAVHTGIAPGADVFVYKVLADNGSGSFSGIRDALAHLRDNHEALGVTALNMSIGDSGNWTSVLNDPQYLEIEAIIDQLRADDIVVCISAGNSFFGWGSAQGMGFPGICRSTTSVGAVYDASLGGFSYGDGAQAFSTGERRITPFSQRLHPTISSTHRTDIFAPGAALTSAGIGSPTASSVMHGTSQASPCIAGVALLIQEYHLRRTGELPTVNEVETWLRNSARNIVDGDDEDDNVANTGLTFKCVDALDALGLVRDATAGPRNKKPIARAGRDIVVNAKSERGVNVRLDGSASSDPEGKPLRFRWTAKGIRFVDNTVAKPVALFPVGAKNVTLTVTDKGGLKDTDVVRVTVRLRNARAREQGAEANLAFAEAEANARAAVASAGPSAAAGASYASIAVAYGDSAGDLLRWEEGQSEQDAFYAYAEARALQSLYGAAAAEELHSAYAETGDESLLAAYSSAVYGTAYASADLTLP